MSIAAIVRALVAAGATPEMILAAVEAAEGSQQDALAARRANDAKRAREYRERHVASRDVTVMTVIEGGKEMSPHTPLRETTLIPPSSPTGTQTPKGSRQAGQRLPADWSPKPAAYDYAAERTLTPAETDQCAAEMREWALANANRPVARKADWDMTFLGFIRRFAERKARAGPRQSAGKSTNRWDEINLKLGEA